jgi:hypothetical protein
MKQATPVKWVWRDRIVLGMSNLMMGEEGIGKGTLTAWVIAGVTRGALPGDLQGQKRRVLVIGNEDSWKQVWTPRLEAAGVDRRLCHNIVPDERTGEFNLKTPTDRDFLRQAIVEHNVALVFFDQVLDNIGDADENKTKQVRTALRPLIPLAETTNCAILMSTHPNKRQGSFRDRISGSAAFNQVCRASLYVARHPYEPDQRVVVRAKGNYGDVPPGFEFRIDGKVVHGKDHMPIPVSYVAEWSENADIRADDVLHPVQRRQGREDTQVGRARKLLEQVLADGKDHHAKDILAQLAEQGISEDAANRASLELRVTKTRTKEFQGRSVWRLNGQLHTAQRR